LRLEHRPPWLVLELDRPHDVAGWPVLGPAIGRARSIAWLQVKPGDLPLDVDPQEFFRERAARCGLRADIGLMTGADLGKHAMERRVHDGAVVTAIATVGLGNAVAIGSEAKTAQPLARVGTINVVAVLDRALSLPARLEALSIAAEARTAAVVGLGRRDADGTPVTGTGTDCIVIAAPPGDGAPWCGLHTPQGRALGAAVHAAVIGSCRP
jgi:adenosylcobinamide amidohydrolase